MVVTLLWPPRIAIAPPGMAIVPLRMNNPPQGRLFPPRDGYSPLLPPSIAIALPRGCYSLLRTAISPQPPPCPFSLIFRAEPSRTNPRPPQTPPARLLNPPPSAAAFGMLGAARPRSGFRSLPAFLGGVAATKASSGEGGETARGGTTRPDKKGKNKTLIHPSRAL